MKAYATLKNLDSNTCRPTIIRNLSRILDIRIIDIDMDKGILHFLYNGPKAFDHVRRELARIGFPMQEYGGEPPVEISMAHRSGPIFA